MASNTATTRIFNSDDDAFAIAQSVIDDEGIGEIQWHEGDHEHRAIRIVSVKRDEADRIGAKIEARLFRGRDRETGLYPSEAGQIGYSYGYGFAAVWIR